MCYWKKRIEKEKERKERKQSPPSLQMTAQLDVARQNAATGGYKPRVNPGKHQLSGNKDAVSLEKSQVCGSPSGWPTSAWEDGQWLPRKKNHPFYRPLAQPLDCQFQKVKTVTFKDTETLHLRLERGEEAMGASDIEKERETEEMFPWVFQGWDRTLVSLHSSQHVTIPGKHATYIRVGKLLSQRRHHLLPFLTMKCSMHKGCEGEELPFVSL